VRRAPNKLGRAVETRSFGSFRIDAGDSAEEERRPARTWSALGLDDKEAGANRRARLWALVLMAGSSVAATALFAFAWLLVQHFF
jgi:hypothetical protein